MDNHNLPYSDAELRRVACALGYMWPDDDGNPKPLSKQATIALVGYLHDDGIELRIPEEFRDFDDVPLIFIERAKDYLQQAHDIIGANARVDDSTGVLLRKILALVKRAYRSYLSDPLS